MYRGKSWNYMETISPAGRSPHPLPPSLSLSSLCIGGKTIFVESDPTEGRKKAEIGGLVYWLETDRTGSNKLVEASGRNQRCKWPVGPHKESRIRKEGKKFFFSPPFFASSRPWTWTDFWSLFSGNEKRGGSVIDEINWRVWFFRRARSFWLIVRIFYERILNPSVPIDKDGIDNFYLPCDSTKQREEMELRRKKGGKEGRKEKLAQRE